MKKLITILLTLSLVVTSVICINDTQVSAATKKTGVKLTVSNCSINTKMVSVENNASDIWNKIYDTQSGAKPNTHSISKVKNNAFVTITANEPGVLYLYNNKSTTDYHILGCYKKNTSYRDHGFFQDAYDYSLDDNDTISEKFEVSTDNVVQYPMYTNEVIYLYIPQTAKINLYWLPSSKIASIKEVKGQYGELELNLISSDSTIVDAYAAFDTKLSVGYSIARNIYAKCKVKSISGNKLYTTFSPEDKTKIKNGPIALEGLLVYSSKNKSGQSDLNFMVIRCSDLRRYDSEWKNSNGVPKPISMMAGTNIIIGIIPSDKEAAKVNVQIGKKTYTATSVTYTGYDYNAWGWKYGSAVSLGNKFKIYTVILNSNLKSGNTVSIWYDSMDAAKLDYKVQ